MEPQAAECRMLTFIHAIKEDNAKNILKYRRDCLPYKHFWGLAPADLTETKLSCLLCFQWSCAKGFCLCYYSFFHEYGCLHGLTGTCDQLGLEILMKHTCLNKTQIQCFPRKINESVLLWLMGVGTEEMEEMQDFTSFLKISLFTSCTEWKYSCFSHILRGRKLSGR